MILFQFEKAKPFKPGIDQDELEGIFLLLRRNFLVTKKFKIQELSVSSNPGTNSF